MPTYNENILPSSTGFDLGNSSQQWDVFAQSVTVGGGTPVTGIVVYSQAITPASVDAANVSEQAFTVTGLTTADKVFVNPPAPANAAVPVQYRVSAADTLAITYQNSTAGALTPVSGTYVIVAIRS